MIRSLLALLLSFVIASVNAESSLYSQLGIPTNNTVTSGPSQPLSASKAFQITTQPQKGKVLLHLQVAKDYYLYRDKLSFKLPKNANATIGHVKLPNGIWRTDPFFGRQQVYTGGVDIVIPILGAATRDAVLTITSQGCSDSLCYPPQHHEVKLIPNPQQSASAQDQITHQLSSQTVWLSLLSLFGLGILLAFTPCVLPMVPILSGIILGQTKRSFGRGLALSISYVLGMAITYAFLGYLITRIGASFQAALQTPSVIIATCILFVVLACSMFGLFNIQLPLFIRHKVLEADQKLKGGSMIGVFVMGILSTLVISPCTSAPLIGVLGFMIQTGNTAFGALSLFVMAIGMGIPLVIISVGLGKWLPKTGAWMQHIRVFVGVLMLCVALLLLSRIVDMCYILILAGVIAVIYAVYFGTYRKAKNNWGRFARGVGLVMTLYGMALVVGGLMGNSNFLTPLTISKHVIKHDSDFIQVKTLSALQTEINKAHGRPVIIDFYAHWCVECRKLEAFVFSDPGVKQAMKNHALIQVDVTDDNADSRALMDHYHVIGLPTVIFMDKAGKQLAQHRLVGDISKSQFLKTLSASIENS